MLPQLQRYKKRKTKIKEKLQRQQERRQQDIFFTLTDVSPFNKVDQNENDIFLANNEVK